MTHKAMVTVRALEEIASMADWQTGVPVDTEAANEHAMIAQRMADVARAALTAAFAQAETQPVAWAWEGATGMRGLVWDEPKRDGGFKITPLFDHAAPPSAKRGDARPCPCGSGGETATTPPPQSKTEGSDRG